MAKRIFDTVVPVIIITAVALAVFSCSSARRVSYLKDNGVSAGLSLPSEGVGGFCGSSGRKARRDTFTVHDFEGREVIIMNAVRDEDGEMVAHDVIDAAVVTARFRNVAERHGKVDLQFNITVPESMRSSSWQLRFHPDLYVLGDTLHLDPVIITGEEYRRAQLRGYQQYERFLASIVQDSTRFVNMRQLEIFIERNIPALYAFRTDSSYVCDERFRSAFGVTGQQALEHYTNRLSKKINSHKKSRTGRVYGRYVKVPIVSEGVRLDTVLRSGSGEFVYCYTQTIETAPALRKAEVTLGGEIYESDRRIYTVPRSEPLSFYISSLSAFVDGTERYLTRVVERRAVENTACYIDFRQGSADMDDTLGNNASEIGRIRSNLRSLVLNEQFDLDSIVVTAYASPEGSAGSNESLCERRAASASAYFADFLESVRDSIRKDAGFSVEVSSDLIETVSAIPAAFPEIRFLSRSGGENWTLMRSLVDGDELLPRDWKDGFMKRMDGARDMDSFERSLCSDSKYRYIREHIYPRLRVVKFDFHMHRKGMVKDTVHTTEPDTLYRSGVQAIRDRDYRRAIGILRPYNDFNTAVAYTALDYNASAMSILERLPSSGEVEYLKAIIHVRRGDIRKAVQSFLNSVSMDPSFYNRGNLDPEIRNLISEYGLVRADDPGDYDYSL